MRKGLQSIDFIGGIVLFLTIVVYIAFSVINTAKVHDQESIDVSLHQEAWFFSQKIVQNITGNGITVNNARLAYYSDCMPGNIPKYTQIRDALGVDFENSFRFSIESHAVALAEYPVGENYVGNLSLQSLHPVEFVHDAGEYKTVRFDGAPQQYDDNITSATSSNIMLEGTNYTIQKIDTSGQYIILTNTTALCGITPPLQRTVVAVERYLVKDNQLFKIRFEYW